MLNNYAIKNYSYFKAKTLGFSADFDKAKKNIKEGKPLGRTLPNGLIDVPEDLLVPVGKGPERYSNIPRDFHNQTKEQDQATPNKSEELWDKHKNTAKILAAGIIGPKAIEKGKEIFDSLQEQSEKVMGTAADSAKVVIEKVGDKAVETIEKVD